VDAEDFNGTWELHVLPLGAAAGESLLFARDDVTIRAFQLGLPSDDDPNIHLYVFVEDAEGVKGFDPDEFFQLKKNRPFPKD